MRYTESLKVKHVFDRFDLSIFVLEDENGKYIAEDNEDNLVLVDPYPENALIKTWTSEESAQKFLEKIDEEEIEVI